MAFQSLDPDLLSFPDVVPVAHGITLSALHEELKRKHEALGEWERVLLAVNGEYVDPSHGLREGDVVAVFPPVSGG